MSMDFVGGRSTAAGSIVGVSFKRGSFGGALECAWCGFLTAHLVEGAVRAASFGCTAGYRGRDRRRRNGGSDRVAALLVAACRNLSFSDQLADGRVDDDVLTDPVRILESTDRDPGRAVEVYLLFGDFERVSDGLCKGLRIDYLKE